MQPVPKLPASVRIGEPEGRFRAYMTARNPMHRPIYAFVKVIALIVAVSAAAPCFAQNDFNLNVHANSHATAKDLSLARLMRMDITRTAPFLAMH